jgi:hypothetical protein
MAHEFKELVLDGHNYHTWAMDVNIRLDFRGIWSALSTPGDRDPTLLDSLKYQAEFII